MICDRCGEPVDAHWTLSMTPEELDLYMENERVCFLTRGDVEDRIRAAARG